MTRSLSIDPRRVHRFTGALLAAATLWVAPCAAAAVPDPPSLEAGAGQADITPPRIGYYQGGWTRADRKAEGVQSRLWAKAIVLKRGDRKVALVSVNLFMVPGGWQQHVAQAVSDLGYRPDNVLISASHTHAGPGGFANYPTLNTASPNLSMILTDVTSLSTLLTPVQADRQLYTFLVRQVASAIRAADDELAPAVAGWGEEKLVGLTQNRSLEAHLANHGIAREPGQGNANQDPEGAVGTIDPNVDVLRVDHVRPDGRQVPIGAWSQFANHGTVVKSELRLYTADHHAAATQVFERGVRAEGNVPADRPVVNVYGNGAEGDQTSGIKYTGPAGAQEVGTIEANAMLAAWRSASTSLSRTPVLDLRATQVCFCGQYVAGQRSSAKGNPGVPFITGSEEGRGPLYDVTKTSFEGIRSPIDLGGGQGRKIIVPVGEFPRAVPTMVVRIGDRMIASLPGEPTKEVGSRVKAAVLEASAAVGVTKVVIAGLANEYINYITTPQEYATQHYEGASTMFGTSELAVLQSSLVDLTSRLASGTPADPGTAYDATRGILPNGPSYPAPATSATVVSHPAPSVERLGQAAFSWRGGLDGRDLPVGKAFIRAERSVGGVWTEVDNDLGLAMMWRASANGGYNARWEVPLDADLGTYRLVVTAPGYRLESRSFSVVSSAGLLVARIAAPAGEVAARVTYRPARENVDLTARPPSVETGTVVFNTLGGLRVAAPVVDGIARASIAGTASAYVLKGAATDRFGNTTGADVRVR